MRRIDPAYLAMIDQVFEVDAEYPLLGASIELRTAYDANQPRDDDGKWTDGGGSSGGGDEAATQQALADAQTNPLAHPEFVLGLDRNIEGMNRYVAAYGQEFKAQALPSDVERGEPKECYRNASLLVMERSDLTYAEGFATVASLPGLTFAHAWAVDRAGNVIDPTWDDPETSTYFGVKYDRGAYLKYLYTAKIYGVLGSTDKNAQRAVDTGAAKLRGVS